MPTPQTLRALVDAATYAARAVARRREAAGLGSAGRARKVDDFLQAELFPPPEVVGGVSIPAPRIPRAGEPSVTVPVSPGPPPPPAPFRDISPLLPTVSRPLPRAARQAELFRTPRAPWTRAEAELQEATRSVLSPELASVAENVVRNVARKFERVHPKDIGRWGAFGRHMERQLSPEDLRQEAFRLIQQRIHKLPPSPAALEAYLYPRVRKAALWQVRGLTRPVRVPEAEQRVLSLEQRIRTARERLGLDVPQMSAGEIFRRLAQDPGFAATLRRGGGKRYFGTQSGAERTLEAGLPKAAREAAPGVWVKPGKKGPEAEILKAGGRSPLDELLAKEVAKAGEEFTGPMARMELSLRALTEKQREVVTRAMGLGRPAEGFREIARDMKVSHVTVLGHYKAAMKRLQAATAKPRLAPRAGEPVSASPAPVPRTAKELVEERLRETWRRSPEARRRWEVTAPIRRMREKEPTRGTTAPPWRPGEAVLPTDPARLRELTRRYWERRS